MGVDFWCAVGKGFVQFVEKSSVLDALTAAEPKVPHELRVPGMDYAGKREYG